MLREALVTGFKNRRDAKAPRIPWCAWRPRLRLWLRRVCRWSSEAAEQRRRIGGSKKGSGQIALRAAFPCDHCASSAATALNLFMCHQPVSPGTRTLIPRKKTIKAMLRSPLANPRTICFHRTSNLVQELVVSAADATIRGFCKLSPYLPVAAVRTCLREPVSGLGGFLAHRRRRRRSRGRHLVRLFLCL